MTSTPDHLAQSLQNRIQEGIRSEIAPLFDELRRFTDRRIAELSSEIHATVQLFDFGETNLSSQLAKIQEQVAMIVAVPAAATHNSGLELEAVVQATETAANQIMEAAEAISDWLRDGSRDVASIEGVAAKLNNIFEACTFQDITGQRIRRAIQHLQQVETMLTEVMPNHDEPAAARERGVLSPDLVQADVDRVFAMALRPGQSAQPGEPVSAPAMAQDDVDQMFAASPTAPATTGLPQDDIDQMFGGPIAISPPPDLAQNDIDRLFGTPAAPPGLAQQGIDQLFGTPAAAPPPELAQNDADRRFAAAPAGSAVPDGLARKPELAQDEVDRLFR